MARSTTTSKQRPPQAKKASGSRRSPAFALHVTAIAWAKLFAPGPLQDFMAGQFGGQYQFLTILSLAATLAYFVVAIGKDIAPKTQVLTDVKNAIGSLVIPTEGLVSVLYWGIKAIDPKLMVPPDPRLQLPFSLDASIHAAPAAFLWLDFLLFTPNLARRTHPYRTFILAIVGYASWMEYVVRINGRFPYPFLEPDVMPPPYRLGVYVGSFLLQIALFETSLAIHRLVHGRSS